MTTEITIKLRTELEAIVWNDVYLNYVAEHCEEFITELPFGLSRSKKKEVMDKAMRVAYEAVLIYRSGL